MSQTRYFPQYSETSKDAITMNTQAKQIAIHLEVERELRRRNMELERENVRLKLASDFYNLIITNIKNDEVLQDAWAQFIILLKLRLDKIPGLTTTYKVNM